MSVLWKKIEFYKGKGDCEAIVIAAWDLGQSPGGLLGGKVPNIFGFLLSLWKLNSLQLH